MTSSSAQVETSPESPATVPTLQERAGKLAALGWTGREAEWLALVALHSGVFTRSQWCQFFDGANREAARVFVRALIEKQLAIEDERPIFPGGARAVLLTGKPIYRALGIPDVRHRRSKGATTHVLMRRLLSLDYIIERPTFGWLPTEDDKVQRFEALGLDRANFPYRKYGQPGIPRYFAFKLPIAVDDQAATFAYVDSGQTTDSELRAWGAAHAPLWAALRARTFAVHVVAVGTGAEAADRAAPVLKRWTEDGDGTGATDPTGPTQADPDIRQEIARLKAAITHRQSFLAERVGRIQDGRRSTLGAAATPRRHAHQNDGARGDRPLQYLVHCPADHSQACDLMLPAVFGLSRGNTRGNAEGNENLTRTLGGVSGKQWGGVSGPPLPLSAGFVLVFHARPDDPSRASGEGEDGSDPPPF